ncbi:MAG: HYR domain-containing protein, partial [Saprospiraceae bacterium]|nr:HYR domain-containing protein [Saprospiraceae bacterium]
MYQNLFNYKDITQALALLCFCLIISNHNLSAQSTQIGGGPIHVEMAVTHCYTNIVDNDSDNGQGDANSQDQTENNKTEYRWKTSWRFGNDEYNVGHHECFAINRWSEDLYITNEDNLTIYNPPGFLDVSDLMIFDIETNENFDPQLYALGSQEQTFGFWEEDVGDNCRRGSLTIIGSGGQPDVTISDDYGLFFANEISFPNLTICNVPPMSGLGPEGRFYTVTISATSVDTQTGARVSANYTPPAPESVSVTESPCAGYWFRLEVDDSECRNSGGNTWNELYDIEIETSPGSGAFELVCDNCDATPSLIIDEKGSYEIRAYGVSTASPTTRSINYASMTLTVKDPSVALDKSCPSNVVLELDADISPDALGYATLLDGCISDITYSDTSEPWECSGTRTIRTWDFLLGNDVVGSCVQTISQKDLTPPLIYCRLPELDFPAEGCSVEDFYLEQMVGCDLNPSPDCETTTRVRWHPYSENVATIDPSDYGPKVHGNYTIMSKVSFEEESIILQYYDTPLPVPDCQSTARWERTFIAYDTCGNSASCSINILMQEGEYPFFEVPDTAYTGFGVEDISPENYILYYSPTRRTIPEEDFAGTVLTCTSTSITYQDFLDTGSPVVIRRNWIVTNKCGRTSTRDQLITIEAPPTFPNGCDATIYLGMAGVQSLYRKDITPAVDDITPEADLIYLWSGVQYNCDAIDQSYQVEIIAIDESGNQSAPCISTVTVRDTIKPTITCNRHTVYLDQNNSASYSVRDFITDLTDNCLSYTELLAHYSVDGLPAILDCSHLGDNEITLVSNGLVHGHKPPECITSLTVVDTIAPVITCRDTTIYIDQGNAPFTQEALPIESVFDACYSSDELSYTWKKTTSFTCADLGSDENFWIEVKDPSNNSSQCIFTVTVLDTTAANVKCRDLNIELTANNDFTYTLHESEVFTGLTSLCNSLVDHPGTLVFSDDSNTFLDCDDIGSPQTVALVYTPDDGSPASSCTSTISVRESLRPNITCPTGIIDVEATYEDCGAFYEYEYTAWDDECPEIEVSFTEGLPSGSIFPIGWNDVKIAVQDKSGNATACSFVVRVAAPSAVPTLECPEDYTVLIPGEDCSIVIDTAAIFHQTCKVQNTQYLGPVMGSEFEVGNYTFGFKTRNTETNLSSQCSFTVTVDKASKKPLAICKDTTVVLTNGQIELAPSEFDGGSYDSCYELDYWVLFDGSFSRRIFGCADLGQNDFRLRVYNSIGAWSECQTRVTFVLEDPQCQNITAALDDTGTAVITPEDILVADGACTNSASISLNKTAFDCSDLGANLVTLTRQAAGHSGQCTATVTVTADENDITPPVALCIPDTTVYVGLDWTPLLDPTTIDAGSYDIAGCVTNDNINLWLSDDVFFCADLGPYEYFLTVTDASGNQSTCSTIVTIADILGPEIIHCRDISIELDEEGTYTLTNSDIQQAFQTREVCLSAPNDVSQVQFDFDCTDLGQTIPMTIVGRDYHGNTSECDFSVTVNMAADGVPTAVCQDVTVELSDGSYSNELLASLIDGGSTSSCGLELSVSNTSFHCSNVGDNAVTLTVTNEIGNTSNCQATVTVLDKEAPSAICQNITIQLDENGLATTTATAIDNGSSDDCGLANLSLNQAAFSCEHIGDNSVTLTVTDNSGNANDCQATVTVQDPVDPIALCQDITVDLDEDGQAAIAVAQIDNGSNDACGIAALELDKTNFDCSDVGTQTVLLTATDENGNTASCQASVTIQDVTPPILFCLEGEVNLDADGIADIT